MRPANMRESSITNFVMVITQARNVGPAFDYNVPFDANFGALKPISTSLILFNLLTLPRASLWGPRVTLSASSGILKLG